MAYPFYGKIPSYVCGRENSQDLRDGKIRVATTIDMDILDCPFCHCHAFQLTHLSGGVFILCLNCKSSGPVSNTEVEAVERWNSDREGRGGDTAPPIPASTTERRSDK